MVFITGKQRQARWDNHKRIGDWFEDFVLRQVRRKYPDAVKAEEACDYYDIAVPSVQKFIECKLDKKSKTTGNIFIESLNSDQYSPAGIVLTKATHWALGFWNWDRWVYCYVESGVLRGICPFCDWTVTCEGSGGYVVPLDEIRAISGITFFPLPYGGIDK